MLSRLAYRARQFWNALPRSLPRVDTGVLLPHLSSSQIVLFRRMHSAEQIHAWQVLNRLTDSGLTNPHLLTAALLHDVGKILVPLSLADRVVIVLGKRFFPRRVQKWSESSPTGLRRPFVTAVQHPAWGADLVEQTGASPQTVAFIRHHHDAPRDDPLLIALQKADNES